MGCRRVVPDKIKKMRVRAKYVELREANRQLQDQVAKLAKQVEMLRNDVTSKTNYISKMWVSLQSVPGAINAMKQWKLSNPNGESDD